MLYERIQYSHITNCREQKMLKCRWTKGLFAITIVAAFYFMIAAQLKGVRELPEVSKIFRLK